MTNFLAKPLQTEEQAYLHLQVSPSTKERPKIDIEQEIAIRYPLHITIPLFKKYIQGLYCKLEQDKYTMDPG